MVSVLDPSAPKLRLHYEILLLRRYNDRLRVPARLVTETRLNCVRGFVRTCPVLLRVHLLR